MPRLRRRIGGAWADTNEKGAVRLGGVTIPFGPPVASTVDEYLLMPDPVNKDWADSNTNVGTRFAVTKAGSWIGVRYWRPPTYSANGTVFGVNQDTGTVIAQPPVAEAVDGLRNAYVSLNFVTPVSVSPGVNYLALYHTSRYGFTRVSEGAALPFASASGFVYTASVMSSVAFYRFGGELVAGTYTASPNFHFHVSPIVRFTS